MLCLGAALVTDVSQIYFTLEPKTDGAADLYKNWEKDPTHHVGCREVQITGGIGAWAKTLI